MRKYDDFVAVNGHSKLKEKSKNTNFAVLTTVQLTQPFNDPIGYGSYIAKLTNILAADNKVILQTYHNFKNSKRTKNLYRVLPTLESSKYILGDVNLAFPRRINESIIDFIEHLEQVIPELPMTITWYMHLRSNFILTVYAIMKLKILPLPEIAQVRPDR